MTNYLSRRDKLYLGKGDQLKLNNNIANIEMLMRAYGVAKDNPTRDWLSSEINVLENRVQDIRSKYRR